MVDQITISTDIGDFNSNEVRIVIRIPSNDYVSLDRRALAQRLYNLVMAEGYQAYPEMLPAAPAVLRDLGRTQDIMDQESIIGRIPRGLFVVWCNACGYSVTFDRWVMDQHSITEWAEIMQEASIHDH